MRVALPAFADMHCHLRHETLLPLSCAWAASYCACTLVMPNDPVILTAQDMVGYRDKLKKHLGSCEPLMTIMMREDTTPEMIREAAAVGLTGVKLYPNNVTHGSEKGANIEFFMRPPQRFWDCLDVMTDRGIVFNTHCQLPGSYILRSEQDCLKKFMTKVLNRAPTKLKVVIEHISTTETVSFVRYWSRVRGNIAGTITAHHLLLTLDDVLLGKIRPHNYCAPIAQSPEDREELILAATGDQDCFFLGSDSAPHIEGNKICAEGCAGIATGPVVPSILTELFIQRSSLGRLAAFVAQRGLKFYGKSGSGSITMEEEPWQVPDKIGPVVPFQAGKTLKWKVQR